MTKLGQRIKTLRKEQSMTQQEFAEIFSIGSKSRVSSYESGINNPDDDLKIKIADYFGVSMDWLLGRTNDRTGTITIKNSENKDSTGDKILRVLEEEGLIQPGGDVPDDIADDILEGLRTMAKLAKKKI
tara:strand:+ start:500 stop:886 length:387 start_codon:yes stop_codon:yes gene_type:complete